MLRHMQDYVTLVNNDPVGGMEQYLDKYVYGPDSWTGFLNLIGIGEVLAAARAGTKIYDA
jgi:glutaconate CoA-transferase subunit A